MLETPTIAKAPVDQSRVPKLSTRRSPFLAVALPLVMLALMAWPSVPFMLPASRDLLSEIYQPMQALKFFATKGQAFHKYGPMPNFLLAPGYGVSLAYWHFQGTFAKPASDFPYGFTDPIHQIGFLILQTRVLFLAIALFCFALLGRSMLRAGYSPLATAITLTACLTTNVAILLQVPSGRPDSPMLAFSAAGVGVYLRIVKERLTPWRALCFGLLGVFATSSKELAGPAFAAGGLGVLYLAIRQWKDDRQGARRALVALVVGGSISYALLNIVYAPGTWLARMKFWIAGPGIDSEIWGSGSSQIMLMSKSLMFNFGPGAAVLALIAVAAFLWARPRNWLLLLLPAAGGLAALSRIHYGATYFYSIVVIALAPILAGGVDHLRKRLRSGPMRFGATAAVVLLLGANFMYATLAWYIVRTNPMQLMEEHALAHLPKGAKIGELQTFPVQPGSTRFEYLGYAYEHRPIQELAPGMPDLPDAIYTTQGKLEYINDSAELPARAKMLNAESGFDVSHWHGIEALGYGPPETLSVPLPAWFPFQWMSEPREAQRISAVKVYVRTAPRLR
jgi:hypothetical protein